MASKRENLEQMKRLVLEKFGDEDPTARELVRLANKAMPAQTGKKKFPEENYGLTVYLQDWSYIRVYKARKDELGNYYRVNQDGRGRREFRIGGATESKEEALGKLADYLNREIEWKQKNIKELEGKLASPSFVDKDGNAVDENGNRIEGKE